jgi:hypothetical protein
MRAQRERSLAEKSSREHCIFLLMSMRKTMDDRGIFGERMMSQLLTMAIIKEPNLRCSSQARDKYQVHSQ